MREKKQWLIVTFYTTSAAMAAEKACVPGATIHHMPFPVTPDMVYNALLAADAMGRAWHRREERT